MPHPQPIPLPPTAMCSFSTDKASLAASTPENKWEFHPWDTPTTVPQQHTGWWKLSRHPKAPITTSISKV